jgi:RNase H-fold protein (predicted Holliday junction resolvase)
MYMNVVGLDLSTSICGWAISNNKIVKNAGFFNISKEKTFKEKACVIIDGIKNYCIDKINVEETMSGFARGFTSQQTLIKLVQNKSVICYILEEAFKIPVCYCNVHTTRKKVFGKSRIKGMNPKEFVMMELEKIMPELHKFDKKNKRNGFDKHNYDMYDAIVMSLAE